MKKDNEYMAHIEKAIAEQYGKESVQDFRSRWEDTKEEEYLEQVKQRRLARDQRKGVEDDFYLKDIRIRKHKKIISEDRVCPICKTYSFSTRDDLYMNRFSSCYLCYEDFVVGMEPQWKNGWRPSEEQVAAAIRRRK